MSDIVGPSFDLRGRTALVTGAGKGVGKWIALGLAQAGADVAVAARTPAEIEAVADEVRELGRRGLAVRMDVRSVASIGQSVERVLQAFGRIDVLVNNAGTSVRKAAVDVSEMDYDTVLTTNLKGTFFCSQIVGKAMLRQGSGKIVNIASTAAVVVRRNVPNSVYSASKAGVVMLTRALAEEWAPFGVYVNCVALGRCDTDLARTLAPPGSAEEAAVLEAVPLGRLGRAADVIGPAIFLASDASGFVTGQTLYVDGGRTVV